MSPTSPSAGRHTPHARLTLLMAPALAAAALAVLQRTRMVALPHSVDDALAGVAVGLAAVTAVARIAGRG